MHKSQSLFYLTTALYVSDVTISHRQEHKTTVTTESGNRYNWFECVVGGVRHPQHTQISSKSSTIAADNSTV